MAPCLGMAVLRWPLRTQFALKRAGCASPMEPKQRERWVALAVIGHKAASLLISEPLVGPLTTALVPAQQLAVQRSCTASDLRARGRTFAQAMSEVLSGLEDEPTLSIGVPMKRERGAAALRSTVPRNTPRGFPDCLLRHGFHPAGFSRAHLHRTEGDRPARHQSPQPGGLVRAEPLSMLRCGVLDFRRCSWRPESRFETVALGVRRVACGGWRTRRAAHMVRRTYDYLGTRRLCVLS